MCKRSNGLLFHIPILPPILYIFDHAIFQLDHNPHHPPVHSGVAGVVMIRLSQDDATATMILSL